MFDTLSSLLKKDIIKIQKPTCISSMSLVFKSIRSDSKALALPKPLSAIYSHKYSLKVYNLKPEVDLNTIIERSSYRNGRL